MNDALSALHSVPEARRIYLDLDDVVADTTPNIVPRLNRLFERKVVFDELTHFDFEVAFGLSAEQRHTAMESVHEAAFLEGLRPRVGVVEVLTRWSAAGFHLAILTGRPPRTREVSERWLTTHGVPYDTFACIDKYGRHEGHEDRIPLDALVSLRFALAIEDSAEMAGFLARQATSRVILLDRPWNRDHPDLDSHEARGRILRASSWHEGHTWLDE